MRQGSGLVDQTGVRVQGATAAGAGTGQRHPGAGRFDHGLGGGVNVALPRVHHTAGEQPDIVAAGPTSVGRRSGRRAGKPGPGG